MVSRFLIGFYRVGVDNKFLTNASEGDPAGDLQILCCSEIHPSLEKWSVQLALVRETVLPEVVLHVTPSDLRPNLTRELKFEPARQLVAPVGAIYRLSHNGPPFAVQFKRSVSVGVKPADIAFRKNLCGFPDSHSPAETDHRVDPVTRGDG